MKLSEERTMALYGCIHKEVMKLRITNQTEISSDLDRQIVQLVNKIFDQVKTVLNVK